MKRLKKLSRDEVLIWSVLVGIVLTSLGILFMNSVGWVGTSLIVTGMFIFYVAIVILALII